MFAVEDGGESCQSRSRRCTCISQSVIVEVTTTQHIRRPEKSMDNKEEAVAGHVYMDHIVFPCETSSSVNLILFLLLKDLVFDKMGMSLSNQCYTSHIESVYTNHSRALKRSHLCCLSLQALT